MNDIIYQPSPWQQRFHATTQQGINEVLGAGSAGPGKTFCLLNDCNDQIIVEHERCENKKHKHHQAWGASKGWALHLRRTVSSLAETIALSRQMFKTLDPGAEWKEQDTTWKFSSGFKFQFSHCKDPNDWERFSGRSFTALFFDELTEFDEEQYDQICRRVRSSDPVLRLMLKIRSMSNPLMRRAVGQDFVVKDPNWVRRRFVDAAPEGNILFKRKLKRQDGTIGWHKWLYMPAKLQDNPDKQFVADYELNLLNSPAHIRAALLDGNWYVTAGSFFAEYWRKQLHTCKPFQCPRDWRFFRSMDWGFKAPGCIHWFAMDEDETLYIIRELKFQNKLDTEVAEMVKVIEKDLGLWDERAHRSRVTGVADTQIWEKRGQTGPSIGDNFYAKGVGWERASKRPGSNQLHAQNIIKRLSDHDFGTKTPGLVIFESCQYIIKTLPAIQTSQENGEEPASGGDDHAYDCLKYGVTRATRGRGGIPETTRTKALWEEEDEQAASPKRGRHGYGQELC